MTANAIEILDRIRRRIADTQKRTFDDTEVLQVVDDELRAIYTILRTHGDKLMLDNVDIPVASFTRLQAGVWQTEPPDWIGDIELVEATQVGGTPVPLVKVDLEEKDLAVGNFTGRSMVWHWGPRGTIHVRGTLESFTGIRIWFERRLAPMFYGQAVAGSTSTAITFSGLQGAFKLRDNIYIGHQFEAAAHVAQPTNVGQFRRCTAFVGGVVTVAPAFPAATLGATIAMLLPLPDEHTEYIVLRCCDALFFRQGAFEHQAAMQPALVKAQADFEAGISRRSSGEPVRFISSRRYS